MVSLLNSFSLRMKHLLSFVGYTDKSTLFTSFSNSQNTYDKNQKHYNYTRFKNCRNDYEEHLSNKEVCEMNKSYSKGHLKNFILGIPLAYLICNVLILFIILYINNSKAKSILWLKSTKIHSDTVIYFDNTGNNEDASNQQKADYYDLPHINTPLFFSYSCLTSLLGFIIVITLYSVLRQRFKVPEFRNHSFKLFIMLLFGFLTQLTNFLYGFLPYYISIKYPLKSCKAIRNEMKIYFNCNYEMIMFIVHVIFSMLYTTYSILAMRLIKQRYSDIKENWYTYKLIILIYITSLSMIYILTSLSVNEIIDLHYANTVLISYSSYIMHYFPYFIHILIGILMFSFYFELKYINMNLSQNIEVDFLFEEMIHNKL